MAKKTGKTLSEEQIVNLIDGRKASGLGSTTGNDTISQRRQELLDRYMGARLGDERSGQSQVVTRECMEAVEWTLPSLVRVFASLDQIGEFIPTGPEDEQAAKQESEAVNYTFFTLNEGFMTLYTLLKDVLMAPVAYAEVYWDETLKITKESYTGLMAPEVEQLMQDPEIEIIGQEETIQQVQTQAGPVEVPLYAVEVRRKKKFGQVRVDPVPGEEVIVDGTFNRVSLEQAPFVCRTRLLTRSELIAAGYDEAEVLDLPTYTGVNEETVNRQEDTTGGEATELDTIEPSQELVEVDRACFNLDVDGDGIAEKVVVVKSGSRVLDIEDAGYQSLVAFSAVPVPHSHVGLSWTELVEDLQGVTTTLTRQFLNNLYRSNNPRPVVGRGVNLSDLLNDLPNHPIRATDPNALRMEPTQSVVGSVLPAFQYFEQKTEGRTGVSRATKGLDADALSRVTKGAFLGSLEQANQRIELLTRVIAESCVKPIFLKIHWLLKHHQEEAIQAKIKGTWATVSPSRWKDREQMRVLVGLGTGNKQTQMMILDRIMGIQEKMVSGGGMGTLVSPQNLYNSAAHMIELADLPDPEKYFMNPAKEDPQQKAEREAAAAQKQNPDEALAAAQMELAKVQREKANLEHQRDMNKLQVQMQKDLQDAQQKVKDLQVRLDKQQQEFALKRHEALRKDKELVVDTEFRQAEALMEANQMLNQMQNDILRGSGVQ